MHITCEDSILSCNIFLVEYHERSVTNFILQRVQSLLRTEATWTYPKSDKRSLLSDRVVSMLESLEFPGDIYLDRRFSLNDIPVHQARCVWLRKSTNKSKHQIGKLWNHRNIWLTDSSNCSSINRRNCYDKKNIYIERLQLLLNVASLQYRDLHE